MAEASRSAAFARALWGPLRAAALGSAFVATACAAAPVAKEPEFVDLRARVAAQAEQLAQQQQRIEQLEARLAALASRSQPAPAPAAPAAGAAPARKAAPPDAHLAPEGLKTVKLQPGGRRPLRANPVDRAPRLPAHVELKEPDERSLAELDEPTPSPVDRAVAAEAGADHQFQQAVQALNAGEHVSAQAQLLAFAAQHPRHGAADNALYYAGISRGALGDCEGANALFGRVLKEYPAGDAVVPSLLEKGRCLLQLGFDKEGRALLAKVADEHAGTAEASVAKALLAQAPGTK